MPPPPANPEHNAAAGSGPLLVMKGISKRFPGVLALDAVDLELMQGEILGLIGENGAGKSTLMRILGGIYPADAGDIRIDGKDPRIRSVEDALDRGISVIHQELNLADNLDIASNIFLGREPSSLLGVVRRGRLYEQAAQLTDAVGLAKPVTTPVEDLAPGERQLVEIAKALSLSARVLVLDEPTSSLSPAETERLFDVMRGLRAAGVSMIYISHRIGEVERIADRVIVLRDGRRVGELARDEITHDAMVRLMVGRDITRFFPAVGSQHLVSPTLVVEGVRHPECPWSFSFTACAGEILGIAGLVGAGRTELVRCLFGIMPAVAGRIRIHGREVRIASPADAIHCGIGLVPEDRQQLGLILEMAVRENITLPGIATYRRALLDRRREQAVSIEQVEALAITTPGIEQEVQYLSGGNQQKVALAKWLALRPKVLILDEPTRGIDVGSKSEIYRLVRALADSGVAVIMISSDMEEIIGLADRVLVMHDGGITGELARAEMTEESIMHFATGGRAQ
ncbi:MAG: sugar ABC transporter ATP-binding protein [Armatimonadota bacterium]|nr:MAG: sugar ABC transporter ATP-binding protein [Armatimonadota bacterium]